MTTNARVTLNAILACVALAGASCGRQGLIGEHGGGDAGHLGGDGGATGSGGSQGGTGGQTGYGGHGTGGRTGTGGQIGTGGRMGGCGPVCDIYCQWGNVLDASGCPTCACNPAPICAINECPPPPPFPAPICPVGKIVPPACVRSSDGSCSWIPPTCSLTCPTVACPVACPLGHRQDPSGCDTCECITTGECAVYGDYNSCQTDARCTWLFPGCGMPALASQGCYRRADLGCGSDAECGGGRNCLKRIINNCPPGALCITCAIPETLCL